MFYGTDFQVEDLPLPRSSRHEWALFHEESPLNNFVFSHDLGISLFNHTATFRSESDYPLTTQFIPDIDYLIGRSPVDIGRKNRLRQEGLAPAIYVQSHCFVPSDRDRYVNELSKYIQIDSYGNCLRNKTLPDRLNSTESYDDGEFLDLLADYKFVIAFENAICDDYVTEKLFRAFHVGSIPVYRGSPNAATKWSPTGFNDSVIIADDFDSPRYLARFLIGLDSDDEEYLKYLNYKTDGITNDYLLKQLQEREWGINDDYKIDFIRGFECYVCDRLIERHQAQLNGIDLRAKIATSNHVGCPKPEVSLPLHTKLPRDDEWLLQGWVDSFWYAFDLARAIHEMIRQEEPDSSRVHDYALKMRLLH